MTFNMWFKAGRRIAWTRLAAWVVAGACVNMIWIVICRDRFWTASQRNWKFVFRLSTLIAWSCHGICMECLLSSPRGVTPGAPSAKRKFLYSAVLVAADLCQWWICEALRPQPDVFTHPDYILLDCGCTGVVAYLAGSTGARGHTSSFSQAIRISIAIAATLIAGVVRGVLLGHPTMFW